VDNPVNPQEEDRPEPDRRVEAPPTPERGLSVPATLWIWLAVLLVTFVAPYFSKARTTGQEITQESGLTTKMFQRVLQAELHTRIYLLFQTKVIQDVLQQQSAPSPAPDGKPKSGQAEAALGAGQQALEAIRSFQRVASESKGPNSARKALILSAMASPPEFAPGPFIDNTLVPLLRENGASAAEVAAEAALWRSLYVPGAAPPKDTAAAASRIGAMPLTILTDRALYDLYTRAGETEKAEAARERLDRKALSQGLRIIALNLSIFFVGLLGLIALTVFLIAWRRDRWSMVARVPTQPQRMTWGDLLDVFVFYLAISRGIGFVRPWLIPDTALSTAALAAILQALTGGLGIAYAVWRAHQRGTTLRDLGVRSRNLFGDIGYGIVGYGAALPILFLLSQINQFLFRNNTSATPNPVLPLLAGEQDAAMRFVIFLLVSVGAPLFEEFFFRGALFSGLRTRFGWVASAAISGAIFAMAHPPSDWLPIFGLGFVLATLREMRQSLVPGIVTHFLQNSMAYVLMSTLFSR
jgi:Predicted metal-dependent membrane protease